MNSSPSLSGRPVAGESREPPSHWSPFPYYSLAPLPRAPGMSLDCSTSEATSNSMAQAEMGGAGGIGERAARALAVEEGRADARKLFDEQLARERSALAGALADFTRDRVNFFEKVEGEVVQLALSIAAKIMHREAQLDPMLLAAIVRVALEKIERGTGVVLRVHPQKAAEWQRYFAIHMRPEDVPEIVEDASQPPEQCFLQTSVGTATVGMDVQLKEIEQGLMDLLAARPESGR